MVAKILVCGLPGAGKTTLALELRRKLIAADVNATVIDGDQMRLIYQDVDFSEEGRINQAHRIGELADIINSQGTTAICSFVCPTPATRTAFWGSTVWNDKIKTVTIYVNRIAKSGYADTDKMFIPPVIDPTTDFMVTPYMDVDQASEGAFRALGLCKFDWQKPAAFLLGRYQPFHDGHKALVARAIKETGQCVVAVRDTPLDDKNPWTTHERKVFIERALEPEFSGRYLVLIVPDVHKIVYGRTPGYAIEEYELTEELQAISGTKLREQGS